MTEETQSFAEQVIFAQQKTESFVPDTGVFDSGFCWLHPLYFLWIGRENDF